MSIKSIVIDRDPDGGEHTIIEFGSIGEESYTISPTRLARAEPERLLLAKAVALLEAFIGFSDQNKTTTVGEVDSVCAEARKLVNSAKRAGEDAEAVAAEPTAEI